MSSDLLNFKFRPILNFVTVCHFFGGPKDGATVTVRNPGSALVQRASMGMWFWGVVVLVNENRVLYMEEDPRENRDEHYPTELRLQHTPGACESQIDLFSMFDGHANL